MAHNQRGLLKDVLFGRAPFMFVLTGLMRVISKMIKVTTVKACIFLHDKSLEHRELSNTLLPGLVLAIKAKSIRSSSSATNA
nr:hypothetical protein [Tanacetum cinerariifolium]